MTVSPPADRPMRAYRLAYDGDAYRGFQRQPDAATVEGAVFDALDDLGVHRREDGAPPGYAAAGRTDAGVSALAQTIGLRAPGWLSPEALNGALPADVRAWAVADAPVGFHATHDATARTYEYHLFDDAHALDVDRVAAALERLAGAHDFHNLTPADSGTRRTLATDLRTDGPFLVLTFSAGGFPRQLVRRAVSLVESVATGEADVSRVDRLLDGPAVDGPEGIPPAEAHPLVLTAVDYPDLAFTADPGSTSAVAGTLATHRDRLGTRARVVDRLLEGITAHE